MYRKTKMHQPTPASPLINDRSLKVSNWNIIVIIIIIIIVIIIIIIIIIKIINNNKYLYSAYTF